jgi:hypothetical protein
MVRPAPVLPKGMVPETVPEKGEPLPLVGFWLPWGNPLCPVPSPDVGLLPPVPNSIVPTPGMVTPTPNWFPPGPKVSPMVSPAPELPSGIVPEIVPEFGLPPPWNVTGEPPED